MFFSHFLDEKTEEKKIWGLPKLKQLIYDKSGNDNRFLPEFSCYDQQ